MDEFAGRGGRSNGYWGALACPQFIWKASKAPRLNSPSTSKRTSHKSPLRPLLRLGEVAQGAPGSPMWCASVWQRNGGKAGGDATTYQ